MPQCSAYGCHNVSGENRPISHHRFPSDPSVRRSWILKLSRKDWSPSSNAVVCSAHFRDEDFETDMYSKIMGEGHKSRRRLKKGAIPSQLLRGEKRSASDISNSTDRPTKRRISCYVAQREAADAENELQCILDSSIDISAQESSTTDFSADVRPPTCDRKVQTQRHTSDAWIQCSPQIVVKSVSVQTDNEVEFDCSSISTTQSTTNSTDEVFSASESEPNTDIDEDYDSSDKVSVSTADRRKPRYFVVSKDSIEILLKFCPLCGSPVDSQSTQSKIVGGMLCVRIDCLSGCHYTWTSQSSVSRQLFRSGSGDFELAVSVVLCGGTYSFLESFSETMDLATISNSTLCLCLCFVHSAT